MSIKVIKNPRTGRLFPLRVIFVLAVIAVAAYIQSVPGFFSSIEEFYPKADPELAETLLKISLPATTEGTGQEHISTEILSFLFPLSIKTQPEIMSEPFPEDFVENTIDIPEISASMPPEPTESTPADEAVTLPPEETVGVSEEPAATPEDSKDLMAVTFSPTSSEGYDASNNIFINNQTNIDINIDKLFNHKLSLSLKADKPQILIIHTHGSESFFPDERNYYIPTDIERTEDTRYNVIRLGDELTGILEQKGLRVIHDRNIYDYPTYNGAYSRTLDSITKIIKENPTIQIVIDIHRDSIITAAGTLYKAMSEVGEEPTAQMMFVVGTNDSGLVHPDYKENLAMAVQLQEKLNAEYPSIMRPINLRKERFNQHATHGSIILEVGTSGNTLEEALAAVRRFGQTAGDFWLSTVGN